MFSRSEFRKNSFSAAKSALQRKVFYQRFGNERKSRT